MRALRGFAAFLADLVLGDDWRVALGLAVALALTFAVSHSAVPSWWVLPVAIAALLCFSVVAAWRRHRA